MSKSFYSYMGDAWKGYKDHEHLAIRQARLFAWRREPVVTRLDGPTRLDRARNLGYKAKQGYVMVRTRVRRGGLRKYMTRFTGHKPSGTGINKITASKSIKRIAEERVSKKFPNMEVLNSYWVGEDGKHKYYEVILVDPSHPVIMADPKINWICHPGNTNRVLRGRTSAGKKGRGLRYKGKGSEKVRPSLRAAGNKRQ
ncbi:MAG TPA: 50S ribosomal protein L15e [Candidatus Thermoplasmatota archaeon]|nr:50S ribosomal protein L15e [Candidatus Thermoplasmatota archaeon]